MLLGQGLYTHSKTFMGNPESTCLSIKVSMATTGSKQEVMERPGAGGLFMIPVWVGGQEVYHLCVYDMCLRVCLFAGVGITTTKKNSTHTHTNVSSTINLTLLQCVGIQACVVEFCYLF